MSNFSKLIWNLFRIKKYIDCVWIFIEEINSLVNDANKIQENWATNNSNDFIVSQRKIWEKFIHYLSWPNKFKSNVIMLSQQPFIIFIDCISNIFLNPLVLFLDCLSNLFWNPLVFFLDCISNIFWNPSILTHWWQSRLPLCLYTPLGLAYTPVAGPHT